MGKIGRARGLLYHAARMLGWLQIVGGLLSGHGSRAGRMLANKLMGRKVVSRLYLKGKR